MQRRDTYILAQKTVILVPFILELLNFGAEYFGEIIYSG